jgi:hypothetical protein
MMLIELMPGVRRHRPEAEAKPRRRLALRRKTTKPAEPKPRNRSPAKRPPRPRRETEANANAVRARVADRTAFAVQIQDGARTGRASWTGLARIYNEPVRIAGAGRTAGGPHPVPGHELPDSEALDGPKLGRGSTPPTMDIAISTLGPCEDDFHARFSATGRI